MPEGFLEVILVMVIVFFFPKVFLFVLKQVMEVKRSSKQCPETF